MYTENGAKNRSGSYKDQSEAKRVKHFSNKSLGERCVIYLLKLYISKLPDDISNERFYFQPKPGDLKSCWQHIGRNTLYKMVSSMCEQVGIQTQLTIV